MNGIVSRRFSVVLSILIISMIIMLSGCGGGGGSTTTSGPATDGPAGTITVSASNPQPIGANAYGQNYWCWAQGYSNPIQGTESQAAALKVNVLRAGGYNNDAQTPNLWDTTQVDRYIAYCRTANAEPIFQVSIINGTSTDAANWVNYCNKVKSYNVKYWIIGNEPDLYATQNPGKPGYTVNNYISDFKAYAAAMKAVDPTIKVMGPELSWKYQIGNGSNDWFTPFMEQCHDDVDIVTFHRYPFAPQNSTITNAMSDAPNMRSLIRTLRTVVDTYAGTSKPLAITEANITYDGDPAKSTQSASPNTYYASLWVADSMGVALEEKLWTNAYWSMAEGWTISFLDSNKQPKPIYYGLYMYTNYFGTSLVRPTSVPTGLSVYASRDTGNSKTILMVINKTNQNLPETIQINDITTPVSKQHVFPAYSITSIAIPDNGGAAEVWTYSQANSKPVLTAG
ncbi:MAG TPA: glycoside hydrolase family 44 protein [Bacillota bacterium]|nr:glycoside hydrolase family 44 protein [Bacillota bacterium]